MQAWTQNKNDSPGFLFTYWFDSAFTWIVEMVMHASGAQG